MPVIPEIPNTNTYNNSTSVIVIESTPPSSPSTSLQLTRSSLKQVANLTPSSSFRDDNDDENDGNNKKNNNKKNSRGMRKSLSRIRTMMIRSSSSRKLLATSSSLRSRSSFGGGEYNSNNNSIIPGKIEYHNDTSSKRTSRSDEASFCHTCSENEHFDDSRTDTEAVSTFVAKTQQPLTLLSTNRSSICDHERILAEEQESRRMRMNNAEESTLKIYRSSNNENDHEYSVSNENDNDNTDDETYIHTMVNRQRMVHGLSTLKQSHFLTRLARAHANVLADQGKLHHSVQTLEDLQQTLNSLDVGENIQRGASLQEMHSMSCKPGTLNCMNILRESYVEFGMGTAMGRGSSHDDHDKKLYMVQLFRGRLKDSCSNNNNNNRSSLGRQTTGKQVQEHDQQQKQRQLVDTNDTVLDRFLLCTFCW